MATTTATGAARPGRLARLAKLLARDIEPVEVLLALTTGIWAVVLLASPGAFASAHVYDAMARFAPQSLWAAFFAALTVLPLAGMGARVRVCRLLAMLGHVWLWTFLGFLLVLGNPHGAAYTDFVLAIFAAWTVWRLVIHGG